MILCERCHKERDESDFEQVGTLGRFCSFCRPGIQAVIEKYGEDGAKGWVFDARTDMIDLITEPHQCVLDCGCWAGYTMEELRNRGHTVYGLDIDDNRRMCKDATFWKMDLEKPLPELMCGSVRPDYILFGDVIEHLADPFPALKAAHRWLAPRGKVIVSVPNAGWIGSVLEIANQRFPRDETGHFDKTHLRFYTREQIGKTLNEAGFRVIGCYSKQLPDTPPWNEAWGDEEHWFRFDNVQMACKRDLYDQLMTYQVIAVATPA
jgi:SAM-dependent methyltransferase